MALWDSPREACIFSQVEGDEIAQAGMSEHDALFAAGG